MKNIHIEHSAFAKDRVLELLEVRLCAYIHLITLCTAVPS